MALRRAFRKVLIIDSGNSCNKQTPYFYNFLGQDGKTPAEITATAKKQVENYDTIYFFNGSATSGSKTEKGCIITTAASDRFSAQKLIFCNWYLRK